MRSLIGPSSPCRAEILGNGKVEGVRLKSGEEIEADMAVICTGITPNTQPAQVTDIEINSGIIVNEHMETNVAYVYAVGECTEFEGQLIGLVAPALEQVRIVVDKILGERKEVYKGSGAATTLKVAGVDLVSAGDAYGRDEECETIVSANPIEGVYRKAVIRDDKVVGTVLLGDVSIGPQMTQAVKAGTPGEEVAGLVVGSVDASEIGTDSLPDEAQVCDCNGISKGQIVATIEDLGHSAPRRQRGRGQRLLRGRIQDRRRFLRRRGHLSTHGRPALRRGRRRDHRLLSAARAQDRAEDRRGKKRRPLTRDDLPDQNRRRQGPA